jgi:WD40 repeat protein
MKVYIGFNYGRLIVLNLQKKHTNIFYDFILDSKICSGIVAPIINIDKKLILIGLEKKFLQIFYNKNKKNFFNIGYRNKKFDHLVSFQSLTNLFFSSFNNCLYVWKKKNKKNWEIVNKIISRTNIDFISNILKSNLVLTTDKNSYGVNMWKIIETKLFFCGKAIIKENISGIEGSPFSNLFIINNNKGMIKTYTNDGFIINELFEKKKSGHFMDFFIQNSIKFYDHNNFLTGGTSKNLSLWDLRINKIVQQWKGHTNEIKEIDINSFYSDWNGSLLISRDNFGIIKTWDLRMNNEFHSYKINSGRISTMKLI